jgi:hypothetical protein
MRPDLADPEQRAAYRRELIRYARGWRWFGLAIVTVGVAAWLWALYAEPEIEALRTAGWMLVAFGWAILIGVIVARTRHHKARMAEGPPPA